MVSSLKSQAQEIKALVWRCEGNAYSSQVLENCEVLPRKRATKKAGRLLLKRQPAFENGRDLREKVPVWLVQRIIPAVSLRRL